MPSAASASDTTLRRKQRALFADKITQEESLVRGVKHRLVLEGGQPGAGAMTYPPYYNMVGGALNTTQAEVNAYKASVQKATVPSAPIDVTATAGNAQATITFTAPNNGGSPITSYTVTSSPGGFTVSGSSSPLTITGLTNGTAYTFTVVATNAIGTSVASSASNSVTPTASTIPGIPTLTYALPADSGIYVYVTAAGEPAGVPTNYEYNTGGSNTALNPADVDSPVFVPSLTNGTLYNIRLAATNSAGTSDLSNTLSATPSTTALPTALLKFDPNNSSSYSGSGTTVNNVGSYGALSGTMIDSISVITGTDTARKVFDLAGGRVEFPTFDFGTDITITAWVRPVDNFSINCILANGAANLESTGFKFFWNNWETSDHSMILENGNGSQGNTAGSVENTVTDNVWQHLTCVFKRDQTAAVFLKNGVPVSAHNTDTTSDVTMSGQIFTIGSLTDSSYPMFGQLGIVRVYNSALTAYQVYQDFLLEKTAFGL